MNGWLRCCASLMWLSLGCSGVGRSVVGEQARFEEPLCDPPLPCAELAIAEPDSVPDSADPVDLTQCEPNGALCQVSATMPASGPTVRCATTAADHGPTERTFSEVAELAQLTCTALRLRHVGASVEPTTARIALDVWRQAHLEVASDEPAALELTGGSLEHVSLVLHGPITLRVLDVEQLRDLRVMSDGAAQIELTRVRGASVSIEGPQAAVLVRRSSLERLRVNAQRVDLESSYVKDARWRAEWLNAADTTLLRVHAEVERSVLSACDATMARFAGCRSWTAVQGRFSDVQLSACDEEISLYGSTVERGQLEGNLLLDAASLGSLILGQGEVGTITSWDSQLQNVTFCADQHTLSLGGSSAVRCARCDLAPGPVTPDACYVPGAEALVESSESCGELEALSQCAEPQPERMRPPRM